MNLAREHFFAHAGLAFDEERQVRSSHSPPGRLHVSPRPAFGEAMLRVRARDGSQRILNRQDQVLVVNGLGQEIRGAGLNGLDHVGGGGRLGKHDHRLVASGVPHLAAVGVTQLN